MRKFIAGFEILAGVLTIIMILLPIIFTGQFPLLSIAIFALFSLLNLAAGFGAICCGDINYLFLRS